MRNRLLALLTFTMLTAFGTFAQNDNSLIGRAKGAAHECLADFNGPDWDVKASVNELGICFVSGTIKEVVFIAYHAPSPYARFMPIVVARVQFGCDGEIVSTECY